MDRGKIRGRHVDHDAGQQACAPPVDRINWTNVRTAARLPVTRSPPYPCWATIHLRCVEILRIRTGFRETTRGYDLAMSADLQPMVRTSDGIGLHVAEYGASADIADVTVLMLHGWTLDHRLWSRQIE